MIIQHFSAVTGGQGVTTTALAVAIAHVGQGKRVLFATHHREVHGIGIVNQGEKIIHTSWAKIGNGELHVATGIGLINPALADRCGEVDVVVVDSCIMGGTEPWSKLWPADTQMTWVRVVRGPGYGEVRALSKTDNLMDHLVVVREPGRALQDRDLAAGLKIDPAQIITIPLDPAVARASDAGTMDLAGGAGVITTPSLRPLRQALVIKDSNSKATVVAEGKKK